MNPLLEYFRCPEHYAVINTEITGPIVKDFFLLDGDLTCYGRYSSSESIVARNRAGSGSVEDKVVSIDYSGPLPFDPSDVLYSLRREQYVNGNDDEHFLSSSVAKAYYGIRPFLPVALRKHLQRARLRNWSKLKFPTWPVDTTVDRLLCKLMVRALFDLGISKVPFVWFWPEGASSCAIMTHDVETRTGRDYCTSIMDIDSQFDTSASFQIVPEQRYEVPKSFLQEIRDRGFEINVQDLNHDGFLFRSRDEFRRRVEKINLYGREFGALGFRSAALYRRQEWYGSLKFQYDMSVPSVAHLDPQRGGCCTVMPYFIGDILELPVTTIQDYSLFHILKTYSLELWRKQIAIICAQHGLMNFIIHPDYVMNGEALKAFKGLLSHLSSIRAEDHVWIAKPADVNHWWRARSRMELVDDGGEWRIEGEGKERARIAFACNDNGKLVFELASPGHEVSSCAHRLS